MHLSETTWTDAAAVDTDLAILPVGSTEQHGPHAPLGTDALTAAAVANAGAAAFDEEVVVAPTIPVGVAEEHRNFAGTLWVSPDTFRANVRETIRVWPTTAGTAWSSSTATAATSGRSEKSAPRSLVRTTPTQSPSPGSTRSTHRRWATAAPEETSLVQHLDADLVREDRLDDAAEGSADGWGEWVSGVNLAYDSDEFSENGTVGDPREASAEQGERLLDDAGEALAALLGAVEERDLS